MENAVEKLRALGWDVPEPFLGNDFVAAALKGHFTAILRTDSVAVPDDEEEMIWRLFFAHSQDMQGFRADIFTGGWNESRNPYDPNFRGLRDRWPDGKSMVYGLAALWQNAEAQATLKRISNPRRSPEERAKGIGPAMELLRGQWGNDATRVFAETLEELRGPMVSRKTNMMMRAYVQNSALLTQHGGSLRAYLRSIAPDVYLPAPEIVWAERLWRQAIERDFYNVGPALASYLFCDWLLWLWRDGQIEWFESYKEDSVFLKTMGKKGLLPSKAVNDFAGYCRSLHVPAEWIPARWWMTAFYPLPPRILNEAIWLGLNANQLAAESGPSSEERIVAGITDQAKWPHRTWKLPPYKSQKFMQWVERQGGLNAFRESPAYHWATQRGLIVDDEWDSEAATLPETFTYDEEDENIELTWRINAWLEMSLGQTDNEQDLSVLRRILGEAEYEEENADPYVFWPLTERPNGDSVQPRLLSVEGKTYVAVFTSLAYMQQSLGEDNPYRIKTPLSNVCRFFASLFHENKIPLGTVILNPYTDAYYRLTSPIISRLGGEVLIQTDILNTESILEVRSPSQFLPAELLGRVREAIHAVGWKDALAVVVIYTDMRWSLFVGLPTEDKQKIENAWSYIDRAVGRELQDWAIVPLPSSNLRQLFEGQGEVL